MHKIFVYGTLKKGEGNHVLLESSKFDKPATVKGELFDLGAFPAMKNGIGVVHGEVYHVSPETLERLDRLEGHPSFYRRTEMPLLENGEVVEAYVYEHDFHHVVPRVVTGKWGRASKA